MLESTPHQPPTSMPRLVRWEGREVAGEECEVLSQEGCIKSPLGVLRVSVILFLISSLRNTLKKKPDIEKSQKLETKKEKQIKLSLYLTFEEQVAKCIRSE